MHSKTNEFRVYLAKETLNSGITSMHGICISSRQTELERSIGRKLKVWSIPLEK